MRPDHARAIRERLGDPAALCSALGLEVSRRRRQSNGVYVCCPAHDDRQPSCSVRVARDGTIACCCHSCGWTGDALGLVAAVRGLDVRLDFRRVLEEAAAIAGVTLDPQRPAPARRHVPEVIKIAQRIDALADDWLRGRKVRRDLVLEATPTSEIVEAFELLAIADDIAHEENQRRDAEMDRLTDEHDASPPKEERWAS